ncbi:MAG: glycosyltransferase family 39 protein [Candidatus Latescibacterota bacterium]
MSLRFSKKLLVLLLAAALLRIVFSVFVVGWHAPPRGDEIDYQALSANLAGGGGFALANGVATARRPPCYPVFLAACYKLFGVHAAVGRVIQLILGVVVVLLVYIAAKQYFCERTAWIAAVLAAFNPFLIFISGYLLTENLYMIFLFAFLILFPFGRMLWESPGRLVLASLLLALAALTRPTGFPFTVWVFAILLFAGSGPMRLRIARLSLMMVVWLIPFVPWVIRNQATFGKAILFTTHGGSTFYQGNNAAVRDIPRYHGGVAPLHALRDESDRRSAGEVENNREGWRKGLEFIKENPRDVPIMTWRKFLRFWRLRSDVGLSGVKSGWWWNQHSFLGKLASSLDVGFAYAVLVLPFFLIGLGSACRRFAKFSLLHGVIVMHTLIALVFYGSLRSRIPIEPVIAIFASAGFMAVIERMRPARSKEARVSRAV